MPHPSLFADWRVAKRAAAALAQALGWTLLQAENGKPRLLMPGGKRKDFGTWLSAYSFVYQVRRDQVVVACSPAVYVKE